MAEHPTPSPFTCDTFSPHLGESFSAMTGQGIPIPLELIEATPAKLQPNDGRALGRSGYVRQDPFALLFRGPQEAQLLQGIYAMTHETLGNFDLNLVPVGPGETGWLYEAVFN